MWFDNFGCMKTALTKLKVAYSNNLRWYLSAQWHNSVSEMFVNLNIKLFAELLRFFVHGFHSRSFRFFWYMVFVQGLFYLGILC